MSGQASRPPALPVVVVALLAGIAGAWIFSRGAFLWGAPLLVLGVAALCWPRSLWTATAPPELERGTRRWLLVAILLVAAFFRAYRLVPPGLWGDDAINGLLAYDILDGKIHSPFELVSHSASRFHALTNYFIAAAFWAFGPDLWTLRLSGVVLGFLCVPLLYWTFAPLFGARVALLAAFFFAVSPQQIAQGQMLVQDVTGEFFHLAAMCLFVRGIVGPRRWLIVAASVPLALSLCTYHAYKLGPLIPFLYALVVLVRQRGERRSLLLWLAAAVVVLLVCATPGAMGYINDPRALTGRIAGTALTAGDDTSWLLPLWNSVWRTLTVFHYQQGPVQYHWFGIGTDPALDPILAALVLHGLWQSLRRIREPRHFLLVAWFLVGILPGVLSSEAPRGYRILLATPPIFVWMGLPLERLLAWAFAPARPRRGWLVVAAFPLVAVPIWNFNYYFFRVYTHRDYLWLQGARMVDISRTLRRYGPEWKGILLATSFNSSHESLSLLRRMWGLKLGDAASVADVMPLPDEGNQLVIFDPGASVLLPAVRSLYPDTTSFVHRQPRPRTWWLDPGPNQPDHGRRESAFYLPVSRAAALSARGLAATYLDATGAPIAAGTIPILVSNPVAVSPDGDAANAASSLVAQTPDARDAMRVVAVGALQIPATGSYSFRLTQQGDTRVTLDDQILVDATTPVAEVELAQGLHEIGLAAGIGAADSFELQWRRPDKAFRRLPEGQLYRLPEVHGWLADWTGALTQLTRIEPVPWYQFLTAPVERVTRARWRGRLRVPPGGRWLELRLRGDAKLLVDGKAWTASEILAEGDRDIDLLLEKIEGVPVLTLAWGETGKRADMIPFEAFFPPRPQAAVPPPAPG